MNFLKCLTVSGPAKLRQFIQIRQIGETYISFSIFYYCSACG